MTGKAGQAAPPLGKGNAIHGKDGEIQCSPHGDITLAEHNP